LRYKRLIDLGQGVGEAREVLLGQPIFGTAISIDGEFGGLGIRRTDRQRPGPPALEPRSSPTAAVVTFTVSASPAPARAAAPRSCT
jgi:hypothetical protein